MIPGELGKQQIEIGVRQVGKIIPTEFGLFYLDVVRHIQKTKRVFLFIDENGNIDGAPEGGVWKQKYIIRSESEGIPPSTNIFALPQFLEAQATDLNSAFEMAKEVLTKTVYFEDPNYYDLVVAWCMYTWLRGMFPKNVNLYFLGFPGTGKSQALKFTKFFARYATDYEPVAQKSYKWAISHSLGVLTIDEAEYISKTVAARLRKYHETEVYEQRTIGLPLVGLTSIDIRVDAPIVLAATHVPPDIAFMQRGLIIKMVKGSPEIKDFNRLPLMDQLPVSFAKSVMLNWKKIMDSMLQIWDYSDKLELDERIKDLAFPFAVILKAVGKDYKICFEYAEKSFNQASYTTIHGTVLALVLIELEKEVSECDNKVVVPIETVLDKIAKISSKFGLKKEKMLYLTQYFFSGGEVRFIGDKLCYVFDKKTFKSLVESLKKIEG